VLQGAVAVMAVPNPAPSRIPEIVNIAYYPESKPVMIAKALGWFQDSAKAKLNWTEAASGADMTAAIAAGTADIGFGIGCGPAAAGLSQGIPYRVVAIADTVGQGEDLVVRKAARIAKLADLKGKRIAAPFGSTSHFRLLGLLKVLDLAPSDVVLVDLKPEPMVSAWQRGDIDAAYLWNPARSRLLSSGGEALESFREIDAAGTILADLIIARGLFLDQYPDAVTGLLKAYARTLDMLKAKPTESAELIAQQMGATTDVVQVELADYDFPPLKVQLTPAWLGPPGKAGKFAAVLKRWADFEVDQKLLRSAAPAFDKFIDTSALQKAS
jgi:taurine transport system substrate-binding protein